MGDEEHPTRRRILRPAALVVDLLVLVLVLAAGAQAQWDLTGHLGIDGADPAHRPAQVAPPVGLDLPATAAAGPVAGSTPGGKVDPAKVRAAIAPYVGDKALGRHVVVHVADLATGDTVLAQGSGAVTPASTMKLLTSTAALATLGPSKRFRTSARLAGTRLVLVGGGDPFLMSSPAKARGLYPARADLDTLAARTAAALVQRGVRTVDLGYDASLFTGPQVSPDWPATYRPDDVVPPITALWADEGKGGNGRYLDNPPREAAATFAAALRRRGIVVRGKPVPASGASAPEVAGIDSAPLEEIVERTIAVSDNNAAEVIAHHVGVAVSKDGSFAGGAAAVRQVLGRLGVDLAGSTVLDGSGLSRRDRLTPQALLDVLRLGASDDHPDLRAIVTGMPVAGFTGSLQWRFDKGPAAARGRVRAKTGTLTGVHGLAGIAVDVQGNRMAFVAIADQVPLTKQLTARVDIDKMVAALGACSCGTTEAGAGTTS